MWKYVTRRIRDTFERSTHFDKRSPAVINSSNVTEDKNNGPKSPCCWFASKKCWNSFQSENDTNNKRWNFEHLNRTWIGAITWSSALVFGWYTSQLIHFNFKRQPIEDKIKHIQRNNILFEYLPFLTSINKKNLKTLTLKNQIQNPLVSSPSSVHLVSNDHEGEKHSQSQRFTSSSESSDSDLGEVLNSIENRLGLAAIENGQHEDGLNLLRSAANRNHPPALYNLGLCYELGLGVAVDEKMAMEFYKSAAALQHPGALYNLGIYYGQGRGGLIKDHVTATRLLRLAAIQGQEDAITALKSIEDLNSPLPVPNKIWTEEYLLKGKHGEIIPSQSALFVENASNLHHCNYKYEPVVY